MTYIEAVNKARDFAKLHGVPYVVYGLKHWYGWRYHWTDNAGFDYELQHSKRPVIRFLLLMPNGRVVQ